MKRRLTILTAVLVLAAIAAPVMASQGGAPGDHGKSGQEFGEARADLAGTGPGAVADHVKNTHAADHPAATDVSAQGSQGDTPGDHSAGARDFGDSVSAQAKEDPNAVADYAKNSHPDAQPTVDAAGAHGSENGVPADHELSGRDLGEATSGRAKSEPGTIAEHVANENSAGHAAP